MPPTVTDHLGGKLAPEDDFFVAPPREIGAVKSAYTSLKQGVGAKSAVARVAIVRVVAAVSFILVVVLEEFLRIKEDALAFTILPALIAAPAAFIAWRKTGQRQPVQGV